MDPQEKRKFAFNCGLIDKLSAQDGLTEMPEIALHKFDNKVTHAIQELDKLDDYFENASEYLEYINKASQVQSRIQLQLEKLKLTKASLSEPEKSLPIGALVEKKICPAPQLAKTPIASVSKPLYGEISKSEAVKASVNTINSGKASTSKGIFDYSSIPDSTYKLLIDGNNKSTKSLPIVTNLDSELNKLSLTISKGAGKMAANEQKGYKETFLGDSCAASISKGGSSFNSPKRATRAVGGNAHSNVVPGKANFSTEASNVHQSTFTHPQVNGHSNVNYFANKKKFHPRWQPRWQPVPSSPSNGSYHKEPAGPFPDYPVPGGPCYNSLHQAYSYGKHYSCQCSSFDDGNKSVDGTSSNMQNGFLEK